MTLHWWMHWFWVTTLIIVSYSQSHAAPQSEELQHITADVEHRLSGRQGRAMYYAKTPATVEPVNITENHTEIPVISVTNNTNVTEINVTEPTTVQWTQVNITEPNITTEPISNVTVAPPFTNVTETQNATFTAKKRNLTRPDYVKEGANVAESRIVTEKTLSQETPLSQSRIPSSIESSRRIIDQGDGGMDTGAIAGISFAALVLAALAGSTAFVMYRRRYLNKPQTLNDKCSNPDSSGYLDDSTIRDNSEEMYSLDNDSFLNSLEAMTIQNYWTDTVKHTKL